VLTKKDNATSYLDVFATVNIDGWGGREIRLHTGLGVIGASEDPGGPGLVGGRLVALGQDLAALAAPPAFELVSGKGVGMRFRSNPSEEGYIP